MHTIPSHVVDTHCHVIANDSTLFPITTPMGGKQSDWSKERPVSDAGMLAAMTAGGVSKSVLVQASTCYGHDNRYVAQSVSHHPEAFVGVFSVDLVSPQSCEQISHWMGSGLSGVRVFIAGHTAQDQTLRIDDRRADPLWEHVASHNIPICVQLRSFGLAALATVLERHPKLTVLLDHFARPDLEGGEPYPAAQGLFELAAFEGLYFKLTTHNVRDAKLGLATPESFLKRVVNVFGASRIAWGSNFPACSGSLGEQLQESLAATQSLSASELEWIYSKTAHSLYPSLNQIQGLAQS
jgi:predicted TIM-barrel fold metal-dependent hydrolase